MKKILLSFLIVFFATNTLANDVKEIVSPYAPGGVVSTFARVLQKYLVEEMNVNAVVVNKPGADARIGVRYVASKPADGNTWIMAATGPFLFNQVVYKDLGYNVEDFDLVVPMAQSPSVIVVSNQSGITNLKDFIIWARNKPMNCGTSNSGANFLTRYLVSKLDLKQVQIVPFKGASEVSTALLSGSIECSVDTLQSQLQLHNDNKLKIIAVSSVKTNEQLPTVTLFNEVIPGFSFYSWYGIGVLKNTATEAKQPILTALRKINTNENYRKTVRSLGLELGNPVQDPQAFIRKEYQRFDAIREQFQINKID